MKILVCGLPGSGKSTLSKKLMESIGPSRDVDWINADDIREQANDWDFSTEGRKRQMLRMKKLADTAIEKNVIPISDFICPTKELRDEFNADLVIWMNTIKQGRYEDTNEIFEDLTEDEYDFCITEFDSINKWAVTLADLVDILSTSDINEWVE